MTVHNTVVGTSTAYIGANEGGSFNVNDLVDCGIGTYRIWIGMSDVEYCDDDDPRGYTWGCDQAGNANYGTPTIAEIKADPDVIDWTAWDVHINDPAYRWRTGSNADTAFGAMVQALSANGIVPVLNLRNRDENGWPAWAPNPPTTDEDLNEWWQYAFAVAYWFNVRNRYGVTHWQVHNEPDLSSQGWVGTEAQYAQLVSYAHDAIKTANDLASIDTVMMAPVESQMPFPRTYTYVDDVFSAADSDIEIADLHWYHMNGAYPLSDLEAAIDDVRAQVTTYNPDGVVEPLWISEFGNFSSSSAYDNLPEAMRTARQLLIFTHKGVQGVHIFGFYTWGTMPGLVGADGARTETYYAYRLMIRGLAGAKEQLGTTVGGSGVYTHVMATRDDSNVYVTVLQDNVGAPAGVTVDLSQLGIGSATARVYEVSAAVKDRPVYTPTVASGVFTFTAPANGVSLAVVPRPTDLSIVKTVTPLLAGPGQPITYTLVFSNAGDAMARGVVVTDVAPVSVTVTSAISSGVPMTPAGASPPYVWNVADLGPGDGGVITLSGAISPAVSGVFSLTNRAIVAVTTVDARPGDNTSTASSTVDAEPPAIAAAAPGSGATEVATAATVAISFSEPIEAGTLTYVVLPDPGGGSVSWDGEGTVAKLAHPPFAYQATYTITVTAARDLAGNPLAGAPYAWTIETVPSRAYLPLACRGSAIALGWGAR